jgi:hypothetical protein
LLYCTVFAAKSYLSWTRWRPPRLKSPPQCRCHCASPGGADLWAPRSVGVGKDLSGNGPTRRGAGRARASTRGLRSDTGPSGDCRSGSAPNCDRADRTTSSATGAHVSLLRERSKCRLNWSGGAAPCRAEFNFSTFHRSRRGRKQLGVGRQIAPFAIALAVHNQSGLY